jgi:hypothetical protein
MTSLAKLVHNKVKTSNDWGMRGYLKISAKAQYRLSSRTHLLVSVGYRKAKWGLVDFVDHAAPRHV